MITIVTPSQGADPRGLDDAIAAAVVAAIADESGAEPIVVRGGIHAEMWRGGRRVDVGIDVALPSVVHYRDHWKSISVEGCRYGLSGAAGAVRAALLGDDEGGPVDREECVEVRREDLRALLVIADHFAGTASPIAVATVRRLRDAYAHALDDR